MSTDLIIFLIAVVAVLYGWMCYAIGHSNAARATQAEKRQMFSAGQRSVLQDPAEIKKAYEYHFGNRP